MTSGVVEAGTLAANPKDNVVEDCVEVVDVVLTVGFVVDAAFDAARDDVGFGMFA